MPVRAVGAPVGAVLRNRRLKLPKLILIVASCAIPRCPQPQKALTYRYACKQALTDDNRFDSLTRFKRHNIFLSPRITMSTHSAWQYNESGGHLDSKMFLNKSAEKPGKTLAPDEILVQVISAALNPVDYKLAEAGFTKLMIKYPATPGLDFCGRVVESGRAIDTLVNGQLVFGTIPPGTQKGTLAEYLVTTRDGCVPLPSGLDPDDAATFGVAGLTAYQSIAPFVKKGDKIFINGGSGGTGTFGIQIAKILGCSVTTSCSAVNAGLAESLGADKVIDYKTTDLSQELSSEGLVYDLVVDNVGTPDDLFVQANNFLKETGKFVQVAASLNLKGIGSILSRMLKPAFLGGGKRSFKALGVSAKEDDLRVLGEVKRLILNIQTP